MSPANCGVFQLLKEVALLLFCLFSLWQLCSPLFGFFRLSETPIEWDSKNMKIVNKPDLNKHIRRRYRRGWKL